MSNATWIILLFSLAGACKGELEPPSGGADPVPRQGAARVVAAAPSGASGCQSAAMRESYESAKSMQLTRDSFEVWCPERLKQDAENAALRKRLAEAATAPAAELCAWPTDRMGGARFYVAVRADRLEGMNAFAEPLASFLVVEKFERYSFSSGLRGLVDKMEREVEDFDAYLKTLPTHFKTLKAEAYTEVAKALEKRGAFEHEDWVSLQEKLEKAGEARPVDAFVRAECVQLVNLIDSAR